MYNPKPLKIKKPRKPLNRKGRIGKGNDVFTQTMLETWFVNAFIMDPKCVRRHSDDGAPASVEIKTADGAVAWIHRFVRGTVTKSYWYTGVNVQVAHIDDKCLRPDLRWNVRNVAPLTPANNQAMKYNHGVRDTMKGLMRAWVLKNVRPL